MKRKFLIGLFVFCLGILQAPAQTKFLTYKVNGKASYVLKNRQYALKAGKALPESATVMVPEGSSVLMICEQASKPLTLSKGSHRLANYRNSCDASDQSITANYLKYVWWQMTNPNSSTSDEKARNKSTSGAVSRGCPGLEFFVADTVNFFRENFILTWQVFAPDSRADFMLYEDAGSPIPLLSLPMKQGYLFLDSIKKWLQPGNRYYWTINLDGNQVCDRKLIQVWESENFEETLAEYQKALLPEMDEAERDYQMGFMLEQNGFTGEAYSYYKKAYEAKTGEERYKRTIKRFREDFLEED
jgi:hypothetical protein